MEFQQRLYIRSKPPIYLKNLFLEAFSEPQRENGFYSAGNKSGTYEP